MVTIIKTWPSFMTSRHTLEIFTHQRGDYYFTLGRGRPKVDPERIFFTHRSRIIGSFRICLIVRNEGQLPKLRSLSGETSEWQIKPDAWVAICDNFSRLKERLYFTGFRGWRYFDLEKHRGSFDSKVML